MDKLFKIAPFEDFKSAVDDVIHNLYNVENQYKYIAEDDIKLAKEELKKFILEENGDFAALTTFLESKQYSQNKVSYFVSKLTERKSELLYATLINFHSAYGETVQDFDWFIKLIMGTSELKTLKYPLLQLMLLTVRKSGSKDKKIYDISKEMLDKIITVLEEAVNT